MENATKHRRAALAELFWPDQLPARGRHRLRQMLLDLQRELRERDLAPILALDKENVRFRAETAWLDVIEFCGSTPAGLAQMESRAALYRGEFMAGLALPDCPEFEDWLQLQRENLHRRAIALLEQLTNGHQQAGNLVQALQFGRRHAELAPWDEFAHRRVMQLYALNGQSGSALSQYDHCRRLLEIELGALPSKETQILAERIRSGEFRSEAVPALSQTSSSPPASAPMDRRQVTALYCELNLAASTDPEEAMTLLSSPQARCMEIIRQFSGHIVQTHGGGLLAYFGYPRADEHAALHAVQAALALTGVATDEVGIHAGVHSGLIIAGNDPAAPDVVGKTSKIAIQLRQHVAVNEVAISADTHALVAGYFDCSAQGKHLLSGMSHPMEIYRATGASGAQSRLDAAASLTAFTGRKVELSRLSTLWKDAAHGERRTVLVRGEAGKGKSRLLLALKQRLAKEPHAICEIRCFPEFSQSPFHPLIATLEAIFGFEHGDTQAQRSAKLVHHLETRHAAQARDATPLLAMLLSLQPAAPYPLPELTPQQQKEATIATLVDLLHAMSAQQPLLFVVEDLHWVDPSSLELLTQFILQARQSSILTVLTARPEFDPPWHRGIDWRLDLAPLSRAEAGKMAASISGRIPANVVAKIVERADGVPLFIEEVAKIASADGQAGIPATLNDLLAARLDAMGDAKPVVQLAATIGREFDMHLLRKVTPLDAEALTQALDRLEHAGLILPVDATCRQFKHALIQEAAYQSQTKADRASAHRRIAQALQDDMPEVAANQPEVLAQHWSAAGNAANAIHFWLIAGRHAVDHFAYQEALSHYGACQRLLSTLPAGAARNRLEFDLLTHWARADQMATGFGSESSTELLRRATVLLEQGIGDARDVFQLQWGRWEATGASLGHHEGAQIAEQLLDIAQRENDRTLLLQANYAVGVSQFWMGNLANARLHLEQSVALEDKDVEALTRSHYGHIMVIGSSSYLSWVLWLQGEIGQAFAMSREAVALARGSKNALALAYALVFAATLQRWEGKVEETLRLAEEGRKTSTQIKNHVFEHVLSMTLAWGAVMQGNPDAIAPIRQGTELMRSMYGAATVSLLALFVDALLHIGKAEEALAVVDDTLQLAEEKHDGYLLAELHRMRGMCFQMQSDVKAARQCYANAIATSQAQGAVAFERKARKSLSELE